MSIRFVGVTIDTRCPVDAFCIQAGEAYIAIEITLSGQRSAFELQLLNSTARSRTIGDYRLELIELVPWPFLDDPPIKPADYRVSLGISSN